MITDFYTKPLQGLSFRKMRDILIGLAPFPEEERVGALEKVTKNMIASGSSDDPVSRNSILKSRTKHAVTYADAARSTDGRRKL